MSSSYTVHISEIPAGVTETDIKKYFKEKLDVDVKIGHYKPVKNAEIPLMWARVNFITDEAYQKAIEELRFPQFVEGISSRLLPNDRDIISKDITEKNVFVKGLDKEKYDNEELYDLFKQYGAIDASKVSKTVKKDNEKIVAESNGYGFVKFSDAEKAKEVVAKIQLDDPSIVVEPFSKERKRIVSNNLYIKNFPAAYDESQLQELFAKYGEITSAKVMVDENSGKKFGYVCFKEEDAATQALEMHGNPVGDESAPLYVQRHEKKSIRREELTRKFKKQNLFVTNFGDNVTEDILRDFFAQYGTIRNVKILMKKAEINGEVIESSKCKGFVCFENPEDARKVLDESKANGIWFDSKRLNVSQFEPRSERQGPVGKGGASGNPEIDNIIMQFLQTMSTGGMMGSLPMMNNPPMPPSMGGGNRPNYGSNMPPKRPPQPSAAMYNQRPPQSFQGGYNQNMMGGGNPVPSSMPMMNPGFNANVPQPKPMMGQAPGAPVAPMGASMMPPQSMPPMPISEDSVYNSAYTELVNSAEYTGVDDEEKKNKIGDLIYSYVERKAGGSNAPKITGMIIDLEIDDLEASTSTMQALNEKISEGLALLEEEGEGDE